MERDDPSWNCATASGGDDVTSVHNSSSDAEMRSNPGLLDQHSEDSSPDSASEDGQDSGDSDAGSVIDPGSSHKISCNRTNPCTPT